MPRRVAGRGVGRGGRCGCQDGGCGERRDDGADDIGLRCWSGEVYVGSNNAQSAELHSFPSPRDRGHALKALITGATGFVGGHVARVLAERGDEVTATYRDPERLARLRELEVREVKADVLDRAALRRAMRGCEIVFHTAGYVGSKPRPGLEAERPGPAAGGRGRRRRGRAPRGGHRERRGSRARAGRRGRRGGPGLPRRRRRATRTPSTRARPRRSRPAVGWASRSCRSTRRTCSGCRRPVAAGGDLDADRRQLPAGPAAGGGRGRHEHRRCRGRRPRACAGRREGGGRRALHPRRGQPDLGRGDRPHRKAVRRAPADHGAAGGGRHRGAPRSRPACRRRSPPRA